MFGIWMIWDEVKPCFPGTNKHDSSAGKWYGAGADWCVDPKRLSDEYGSGHTTYYPRLFECQFDATLAAADEWQNRRSAHPPFTNVTTRKFVPLGKGEIRPCVLDLSMLSGGFF